jgi:hypothetical protein
MVTNKNLELWMGNGGFINVRWANASTRNLRGLGSAILILQQASASSNRGRATASRKVAAVTTIAVVVTNH